jgi:SAM-dependent methyltransferase
MPKIDTDKFYSASINKHGISPQGVQWLSDESQNIRFTMLHKLLPKPLKKYSIVDIGCGFGDFYNYLSDNDDTPKHYIGIDVLEKMCFISSSRTKQKILCLDATKDPLPQADYYICSGSLNTLTKFEAFLFIQNCFHSSKRGFIFNFLFGDKKSDIYNYINLEDIKNILRQLHIKKYQLAQGYYKNDFTIGLYK